jgi:lysozyme
MSMFDWLKTLFKGAQPAPAPRPTAGEPVIPKRGWTPRGPATRPSERCIAFIKQQEGLLLTAKKDVDGVYVNGYGCKIIDGAPAYAGQKITESIADRSCRTHAELCADAVLHMLAHDIDLTQGQLDALVDFVYNAGAGALQHSTILRRINGKATVQEAMFTAWSKAHVDGVLVTLPGLFERRQAEYRQFWSQ